MKINPSAIATDMIRVLWFILSISPFAVLFLPWVTLYGADESLTGITSIALLTSPARDYLFAANPVQATVLTFGPAVIVLLTVIAGSRYSRRRSVYWAPPLLMAMALAIVYLTEDLVSATHKGLDMVGAISILLMLHQIAIRLYVFMRRRQPFSRATRTLQTAISAGR